MLNPKERKAAMLKLKQKQDKEKPKQGVHVLNGKYQISSKIGQGVSSIVFSAIHLHTGERVAIKKIKNFLDNKYESLRILREMLLLRKLKHPNIINLKEILVEDQRCRELSLVLDYLPTDAKKLFKSNSIFDYRKIKLIIFQILLGINYCQQCQVLHRDLKPENILITEDLSQVKLCDFGLARAVYQEKEEESEMKSQEEEKQEKDVVKSEKPAVKLTAHVATRWYRAPQLILLERKYSSAIDIWSVGCILGELMTMTNVFTERKPLFPGKACYPLSPPKSSDMNYKKINDFPHSVYDQLSIIFSTIGTPTDIDFISDQRAKNYIKSFGVIPRRPFSELFKFITPEVDDFLQRSLEFNPNRRMTISEAISHKLFDDIRHLFEGNLSIKGEPIAMQLDGIEIEQIREMVLEEYRHYQSLNK